MSGQTIAGSFSEVAPGIFRVVVPLPISDVESTKSYGIGDDDRNLKIDPGMVLKTN